MIHGAELRVHFLKSFQKGFNCENLSQKGKKKDGQVKTSTWGLGSAQEPLAALSTCTLYA
jgi:hypothetical protein